MRLIVLDRDGVINEDSPNHIRAPEQWRALPGSLGAIAALCAGGWTVAVASNQSGVGRGFFDEATLDSINQKMRAEVASAGGVLGRIVYCPHLPTAGCPCRKPRPGLLNQLSTIYAVPTRDMLVIGDSQRDIEAALAVGARALVVRTGNGKATELALANSGVVVHDDLASVARELLSEGAA